MTPPPPPPPPAAPPSVGVGVGVEVVGDATTFAPTANGDSESTVATILLLAVLIAIFSS